jgi:hypothetical protein
MCMLADRSDTSPKGVFGVLWFAVPNATGHRRDSSLWPGIAGPTVVTAGRAIGTLRETLSRFEIGVLVSQGWT